MTGQTSKSARTVGEVPIREWKPAGLLKPSSVKPVLATLEKLIQRKLGELQEPDVEALRGALRQILG